MQRALCVFLLTLLVSAGTSRAATTPASPESDLAKAMVRARTENRSLFVIFGRKSCPNTKIARELVRNGDVEVDARRFVLADIDCDDVTQRALFYKLFKVEGRVLPFVVVATSEGGQLAARAGYGSAQDYEDLLREARRKDAKGSERRASPGAGSVDVTPVAMASFLQPLAGGREREARVWTTRSGARVYARVMHETPPYVNLMRTNAVEVAVRFDQLVDADQLFLINLRQQELSGVAPTNEVATGLW